MRVYSDRHLEPGPQDSPPPVLPKGASVWAHPFLHQHSKIEQLLAVKRRVADRPSRGSGFRGRPRSSGGCKTSRIFLEPKAYKIELFPRSLQRLRCLHIEKDQRAAFDETDGQLEKRLGANLPPIRNIGRGGCLTKDERRFSYSIERHCESRPGTPCLQRVHKTSPTLEPDAIQPLPSSKCKVKSRRPLQVTLFSPPSPRQKPSPQHPSLEKTSSSPHLSSCHIVSPLESAYEIPDTAEIRRKRCAKALSLTVLTMPDGEPPTKKKTISLPPCVGLPGYKDPCVRSELDIMNQVTRPQVLHHRHCSLELAHNVWMPPPSHSRRQSQFIPLKLPSSNKASKDLPLLSVRNRAGESPLFFNCPPRMAR